MADFYIKRGDRLPVIRRTLTTSDGNAINLSGATVNFIYRIADESLPAVVGTGTVTIVTAASGIVEYAWAAADTATAGEYNAEFEAQIGGLRITAPNSEHMTFEVVQDLGDG